MAICQQCGQQIPDNANHCPYCGVSVKDQNYQQAAPQQDAQQVAPQQDFQQNSQQAAPQQDFQQSYQQAAPQQGYQQNYQQGAPQQGYQQNYQQGAPQQNYQQGYAPQQGYAAPGQQAYVTPDMDVRQSKGVAWLSYMGLLFLIPMFVKRQSDFARFHVKQGVTLCAFELAYWLTYSIIMAIVNMLFPGRAYYVYYTYYTVHSDVYNVISVLLSLAGIFFAVLAIIGIVNAATGKKKELPLIGKIPWIAKLLDNTVYKN